VEAVGPDEIRKRRIYHFMRPHFTGTTDGGSFCSRMLTRGESFRLGVELILAAISPDPSKPWRLRH